MAKDQPESYGDIPERRRELYFRVIDNYKELHAITHRLHFLDTHFPPDKIDRALMWLINNGHTGRKFVLWFAEQCINSDLEMHRRLLEIVDNKPLARVIAGKNFKP